MIAYNVVGVGRFQSVVPAKEVVKDTDLILRSLRSKRLEGWTQRADSRPSFDTRAPGGASALPAGRATQQVADIFTTAGTYEIPISWRPAPSRFQMAFYPSCPVQLQIAAEPCVRSQSCRS